MSKLLSELLDNQISLSQCLERLLIVANVSDNKELANWCSSELNGYQTIEDLPEYRKGKTTNIVYSGINGAFQMKGQPLDLAYINEKHLKEVSIVYFYENITDVEKMMNSDKPLYRDLTMLASEVYKNSMKMNEFGIGLQCTSIQQIIPNVFYSNIYSAVRTRVINLLSSYEKSGVDVDKLDYLSKATKRISKHNKELYTNIIVNGDFYAPGKDNKVVWQILIPIFVGVVSAVIGGLIVFFITKGS